MLIGHYGASLLVRQAEPRLSVSSIFVAAQALDILWCLLVLGGIERLRIVPGITATNGLDLESMPYSHSLAAALMWGVVALWIWRGALHLPLRSAALLACLVSAHWPLDWLVHRPDLLVWPPWPKVGLGLWNYAAPAFALEAGLLASGVALYMRQGRARSHVGAYGMPVLAATMTAIQWWAFFGPYSMTSRETVAWALLGYAAFPALAAMLETQRAPAGSIRRAAHLPWIAFPQRRRAARRAASAKD